MQIKIHDIVQFIAKRQHEYHAEYDAEVRSEVDEAYEKRCHMAAGKWLASNELMDDLRKVHLAYVDTLLKEE
jgi:hypothetical protein